MTGKKGPNYEKGQARLQQLMEAFPEITLGVVNPTVEHFNMKINPAKH